jgi:hypothetical protein
VRLRFDVLLTVQGKKRERERIGERAYGTTELSNHHDTRCYERYPCPINPLSPSHRFPTPTSLTPLLSSLAPSPIGTSSTGKPPRAASGTFEERPTSLSPTTPQGTTPFSRPTAMSTGPDARTPIGQPQATSSRPTGVPSPGSRFVKPRLPNPPQKLSSWPPQCLSPISSSPAASSKTSTTFPPALPSSATTTWAPFTSPFPLTTIQTPNTSISASTTSAKLVAYNEIDLHHIAGTTNAADVFPKPLPTSEFESWRDVVGMQRIPIQGGVSGTGGRGRRGWLARGGVHSVDGVDG